MNSFQRSFLMLGYPCRRPDRLITEHVLHKEFAFVAISKQWGVLPLWVKDANLAHLRLIYTLLLAPNRTLCQIGYRGVK